MHVFDDQEDGAVQSSHLPVQCLQAAPVDTRAVHQLPRVALSPCWHVSCKLWEKTFGVKILKFQLDPIHSFIFLLSAIIAAYRLCVTVMQQLALDFHDGESIIDFLLVLRIL